MANRNSSTRIADTTALNYVRDRICRDPERISNSGDGTVGQFLTPIQDIALSLVFDVMNEGRINRTTAEYMRIAENLPALKELHFLINARLKELHQDGNLPEILRFKAGHKRIVHEPFPSKISCETMRAALTISGMRQPIRNSKIPRLRRD